MKRIIFPLAFLLSAIPFFGQDYSEALRFSQSSPDGNSRYVALGGAMSALGANFSAVRANPAGLGVFRQNSYEASLQTQFDYSNSDFMQNSRMALRPNVNISNAAWGGVSKGPDGQALKYLCFSLAYNREQSYLSRVKYSGENNQSSMIDDFIWIANEYPGNENSSYIPGGFGYSDLAYTTYAIDTIWYEDDDLPFYYSDYADRYGPYERNLNQRQSYYIYEKGRKSNTSFTLAANIEDKLFIGASLNYARIKYERSYNYLEEDLNTYENKYLNDFSLDRRLSVIGNGFSADIGLIYVPVYSFRLSAAYKSPVLYYMSEDFNAEMETFFINSPSGEGSTNFYDNIASSSNYYFTSPQQYNLGAAYVAGKQGFLSFDYELKDHSKSKYSSDDYLSFDELNNNIDTILGKQHTFKFGGELRLNDYWAGRAGYALTTSPYADKAFELDQKTFSFGFGFRSDGMYSDISYQITSKDREDIIYQDWYGNNVSGSATESLHKVMLTIGFYY